MNCKFYELWHVEFISHNSLVSGVLCAGTALRAFSVLHLPTSVSSEDLQASHRGFLGTAFFLR